MSDPDLEIREVGVGVGVGVGVWALGVVGGGCWWGAVSQNFFSVWSKSKGGPGPQSPPLDPPLTEGIRKRSFFCPKGN